MLTGASCASGQLLIRYWPAVCYFTGSAVFTMLMRQRALDRGTTDNTSIAVVFLRELR